MSEVKNEGLEVVGWASACGIVVLDRMRKTGSAQLKGRKSTTHNEPLCRHSEALAGYSVRDARITELEAERNRLLDAGQRVDDHYRSQMDAKDAELAAKDLRISELLGGLFRSRNALQIANDTGVISDTIWMQDTPTETLFDFMDAAISGQLYAAPVAKQVVMPDSTDAALDTMRRNGLSIDGDNAYKRDLIGVIIGAMAFGFQNTNPPPDGHWGKQFWDIGRAEGEAQEKLAARLNAADQEGGQDE